MASYLRGGPSDDGRDEDGVSRSTSYRQSQQAYLGANQQQPYDRPTSPHSGSVSPLSSVMSGGQNTHSYQQPYIDHSYFDSQQQQEHDAFQQPAPGNYQAQPVDPPSQLYGGALPPQSAQFPATGADDENDEQKDGVAMLAQSPPARRMEHTTGRYAVFRRWGWEIAALVLAVALLIAMVIILRVFEGQRVPDWGEWVNLNTIMAVLSTVLRGAVAVVIAEIISQAKWEWFGTGRARPLRELQDFDAGSRGIWGALNLVPTAVRGDPVALLAALLLAASFAVGPTVQQAIRSSVCDYYVEGVNASLPFAHFVPRAGGYVQGYGGQRGEPDSDTRVAVSSSLNFPEGIENAVTAACRTGNCTFIEGDPVPDGVDDDARDLTHLGARSGSHSTIGLCHRCLDVTSLVEAYEDEESSSGSVDLGLPNGLNVTRGPYGVELNVTTDLDFDWAGDLVTPEFMRDARWALANVTTLAISMDGCGAADDTGNRNCPVPANLKGTKSAGMFGLKAASCIVYSCVRTYVASVTNGQLDEVEIGSPLTAYPELNGISEMDPEGADAKIREGRFDQMTMTNSIGNKDLHYATVKTPCRANETVWWTEDKMESDPGATKLALYETGEDGAPSMHEVAASEACIYRHNAEFGAAVGKAFKDQLEGSCLIDPRTGPACTQRGTRGGYHKPLEHLYAGGNATFTGIDGYFKSVMGAMTSRYRVTYGSAEYGNPGSAGGLGAAWIGREVPALSRGLAEGVVWQTTVCTVVHWEWLTFSAALVGITSLLLAATIVRSWRSRHVRPVWKANILPLLFHGDRFGLAQGPLMMTAPAQPPGSKHRPTATEAYVNDNGDVDGNQMLMESREMEKQAAQITTVFRWPEGGARHSDDEASPAQGTGSAFRGPGFWTRSRQRIGRKKIQQWDRDSLEQREP